MAWLPILRTLHVTANLFWIGGILAVALILPLREVGTPLVRGQIALRVYRGIAVPGFVVSFVAGATLLLLEPAHYFVHTHMMHAKLPLALGVVALHHWLGRRTRRMATGEATPPTRLPALLLTVGATGAAVLALMKPF
jgi:putative membrane protein